MADKKAIQNLVDLINKNYQIRDNSGEEMRIRANPNLNGWELWFYRVNGGGVAVMLTQYQQVPAGVAVLILKMLYYDILEKMHYGHYTVTRRGA